MTRYDAAKHELLRKKLSFAEYEYPNKDFRPLLAFYRFLAPSPEVSAMSFPRGQRLELWVPNTLVYDGLSPTFWLYSKGGHVYRSDAFSNTQVVSRFGSGRRKELVAIAKTVFLHDIGDDVAEI